jgi:hypothetical protein
VMLKDLMKPLPICWSEQIAALGRVTAFDG